ncbi:hypothetical protein KIPB_003993 [Kipferlia bialata]|uniref:BZIP domain-containing protein n=1 Tax=Kipferlia bialata TaxID=797122 RepID=A0A391NTA5_9EUKA|nr:hypothetical protein KIPB_003993 [Kipferlia bialata]|eukprot:g3993.t1
MYGGAGPLTVPPAGDDYPPSHTLSGPTMPGPMSLGQPSLPALGEQPMLPEQCPSAGMLPFPDLYQPQYPRMPGPEFPSLSSSAGSSLGGSPSPMMPAPQRPQPTFPPTSLFGGMPGPLPAKLETLPHSTESLSQSRLAALSQSPPVPPSNTVRPGGKGAGKGASRSATEAPRDLSGLSKKEKQRVSSQQYRARKRNAIDTLSQEVEALKTQNTLLAKENEVLGAQLAQINDSYNAVAWFANRLRHLTPGALAGALSSGHTSGTPGTQLSSLLLLFLFVLPAALMPGRLGTVTQGGAGAGGLFGGESEGTVYASQGAFGRASLGAYNTGMLKEAAGGHGYGDAYPYQASRTLSMPMSVGMSSKSMGTAEYDTVAEYGQYDTAPAMQASSVALVSTATQTQTPYMQRAHTQTQTLDAIPQHGYIQADTYQPSISEAGAYTESVAEAEAPLMYSHSTQTPYNPITNRTVLQGGEGEGEYHVTDSDGYVVCPVEWIDEFGLSVDRDSCVIVGGQGGLCGIQVGMPFTDRAYQSTLSA